MNNLEKEHILQTKNQDEIINTIGSGLWLNVSYSHEDNGNSIYYWCALIPKTLRETVLKTTNWDLRMDEGFPSCSQHKKEVEYYKYGNNRGIEPLDFDRTFLGFEESYMEVSEEFRHFHNLFHDKKTDIYYKFDESGNKEEIIKIEGENIKIKLKQIKQFLAIKDMDIALYFEFINESKYSLEELDIESKEETFKQSNLTYLIAISNWELSSKTRKSFSRILGKKLIHGVSKENAEFWPYEKKEEFEDFIVGVDAEGSDVFFTCNPEELANYFGANEGSPHYLTPIFFRKDVLTKYYNNSRIFSVEDGYLRCQGSWGLRMDNHNKDYVIVYLGDLGNDIQNKEQKYWKNYNITPDGTLSKTKFKRDFLAEWSSPEIADLLFKETFRVFNEDWEKKYSWKLFLSLSTEDKHNFDLLRIPVVEEQSEFDNQILSLVKVLLDSLNEKEIENCITSQKTDLKGSITKLEQYLKDIGVTEYDKHIMNLRNLQKIRSAGTGHRKGSNYENISKKIGLQDNNFKEVFETLLKNSIEFLNFLREKLL